MKFSRCSFIVAWILVLNSCSTTTVNRIETKRPSDANLEISCIGPDSADTFAIYLHGMDSVAPSQQELENRRVLAEIAKLRNIRFALPRASMSCPMQTDAICWGWKFDEIELNGILPKIFEARSACFQKEKPFWILGFSNGGYLLTRWYSLGMNPSMQPSPTSIVASGSAKGHAPTNIDLSENPELILIVGKQDRFNFDPSEELFHQLKKLKAPIKLIEFQGGHILHQTSILSALKQ